MWFGGGAEWNSSLFTLRVDKKSRLSNFFPLKYSH
jgi:hypothetical protein